MIDYAIGKAKGGGFSIPLDQFEVSLAPDEPSRLVNVRWDQKEKARWSLVGLTPGAGSIGALCVVGQEPIVKCLQWVLPGRARIVHEVAE